MTKNDDEGDAEKWVCVYAMYKLRKRISKNQKAKRSRFPFSNRDIRSLINCLQQCKHIRRPFVVPVNSDQTASKHKNNTFYIIIFSPLFISLRFLFSSLLSNQALYSRVAVFLEEKPHNNNNTLWDDARDMHVYKWNIKQRINSKTKRKRFGLKKLREGVKQTRLQLSILL